MSFSYVKEKLFYFFFIDISKVKVFFIRGLTSLNLLVMPCFYSSFLLCINHEVSYLFTLIHCERAHAKMNIMLIIRSRKKENNWNIKFHLAFFFLSCLFWWTLGEISSWVAFNSCLSGKLILFFGGNAIAAILRII